MYIKKVELENIKSHAEAVFEFLPGSTSISGENGAGKTTIIESIAWTLFDVLDYKKDDFVRRGAKKGAARVTIESGLDEREYTVYRDTGTGYYVYDPQLGLRIAEKKEEVTRFLWQHLGLEPGTDLESLFKHAIGVPQGTFTSIFLATAADRKRTFDTLLKVEEYRRGAEELLKTQRYVENQINSVNLKIARAEGELGRFDVLEVERTEAAKLVESLKNDLAALEISAGRVAEQVSSMDKLAADAEAAQRELALRRSEFEKIELVAKQKDTELSVSKDAAARVEDVRADAAKHTEVLGRISELERERGERDRLRNELFKIESAENSVKAEDKSLREKLAEIANAHNEIVDLRPKAVEQQGSEKRLDETRSRLALVRAASAELKVLIEKLEKMRSDYTRTQQLLSEATAKVAEAEKLDSLQKRESKVVAELARLRAELERDERFQSEIKNGLCPILSQRCLNLKEGETLEDFIGSQFGELRSQIGTLEVESVSLTGALRSSRDAAKAAAQVSVFEERWEEIKAEGKRLRVQKDVVEVTAAEESGLVENMAAIERELAQLDNPKARIELLERQIANEPELRRQLSETEKNLERLQSDRRIMVEQTEAYKELDEHWKQAAQLRDSTAEAHKTFIALESAANQLADREREFAQAEDQRKTAETAYSTATLLVEEASKKIDARQYSAAKADLLAVQRQLAETSVRLENAEKRAADIVVELERLLETKVAMQAEIDERERLGRVLEATVFIRDTLKEAAPLVARNYVYLVSSEANLMYREVTGHAERTLKWAEDYGIVLEEGGYERPFQSLSGGEQMVAALSVRLALLKQLSDIRIAFFDEPTTNMDAERRENLAQQIGQIRHFDQLFVISHDDTFEGYMDHELSVEKI